MRAWIVSLSLVGFSTPAMAQAVDMPAPTPEGVGLRIGAHQNGDIIALGVEEALAVELQCSAMGGVWELSEGTDFLTEPAELDAPARVGADGRPLLGTPRWQVFVFSTVRAGAGDLVFTKLAPVRSGELQPTETFRVTIIAH